MDVEGVVDSGINEEKSLRSSGAYEILYLMFSSMHETIRNSRNLKVLFAR